MRLEDIHTGDQRGTALVIIILIMLALTGIVMGVSSISVNETQLASNELLDKKAFYLAESGVEKSIKYLSNLSTPFLGSGSNNDQPSVLYSDEDFYGMGTVTSYLDPLDSNTGNPTRFVSISVRATLAGSGITKALRVQVGQQNFSRYAYFTNLEKTPSGTTIWFYEDDVFHGPVHTNDQMHIYGSPTFFDEVSSAAASIDYYHGGPPQDNPTFHEGLTLNASRIDLPLDTGMLMNKANEAGGLKISGDAEIEFMLDAGDNPFIRVTTGGTTNDLAYPGNGVIYVDGTITGIKGTVRGQVNVGCSEDIRITDNLVYYTDPRTDPNSTDLCGLVAEQNVIMWDNAENMDSADETVMAAVMTLNTSWTVRNYDDPPPRGKLVVYGGIIQRKRGPVGMFSSSGIYSGYEKNYTFDERLLDTPPPAFPTTGQVEKISWNEIDPSSDITQNVW